MKVKKNYSNIIRHVSNKVNPWRLERAPENYSKSKKVKVMWENLVDPQVETLGE